MRPTVRGLMDKYEGRLEVLVLDYDNESLSEYRSKYRIGSHPSFAVISADGRIVANFVGVAPAEQLEAAVQRALS